MRATPLTLVSPIPRWWSWWIEFTWLVAKRSPRVEKPLRDLEFIHFARWALLPGRRRLLFLTTFDGSSIQYIDAFVRVVPERIMALYWRARGFPGARRFGPVKEYIDRHSHRVDHFWIAHPGASTRMVDQALALAELYAEYEPRLNTADADGFGREWRRFLTAAQRYL
jgi:hypothetical protein